jgi:F-type H+-transporting ATPase subunit epsilon
MNQNFPLSLSLRVITPHKLLVDADVAEVTLPSLEGCLGILPGHRPLFTALGRGPLTYRMATGDKKLFVRGGYAEIQPGKVLVFTELSQDEENKPSPGQG